MNLHGVEVKLTKEREEIISAGWESARLSSMILNANRGDIVFDIGAEQGDMSVMLAKKTGKIVVFEPSPVMWPHIRGNFERNKIKPIGFYAGFVSDVVNDNPKLLNYDDTEKDGWPVCAYKDLIDCRSFRHLHEEAEATKQITLDEYAKRTGIYPNLVTIDVEGSEYNVLQGMHHIVDTSQPIIYVSVHHDFLYNNYKKFYNDIGNLMREWNYKTRFLAYDHEAHFVFYKKTLKIENEVF